MIVLDTNVVSEVMSASPDEAVIEWLDRQETGALYLSTPTLAEIAYGLEAMPEGNRRRRLAERFERFVESGFPLRLLPFEEEAARVYGVLMARRRRLGRPMGVLDGQIAAISKTRGFALATRSLRDFEHCGLEVLNPFEGG